MTVFDISMIREFYNQLPAKVSEARRLLGRPLTLSEKILYAHISQAHPQRTEIPQGGYKGGQNYAEIDPDRVAMQDATAQMALLQLLSTGISKVHVPTTVHCDHLIEARQNAASDLGSARSENGEVYDFLSSCSQQLGIGFWEPGSGIIHQVVLENYAFPGGLLVGTDSHTPNAGGLGMLAVGVGGADAVDAMVGMPWEVRWPKVLGVKLTGKLQGWSSPKDVILKLAGMLTVSGGTGFVVEYFGSGAETLSATGKATICNMGAEIGATSSLFPFDPRIAAYLRATERSAVAEEAERVASSLQADPEVLARPERFYDQVVEIDLSTLEPQINGPFTPDRRHGLSNFSEALLAQKWPREVSAALIGSCTNSSYEDMDRVVSIARAALAAGITLKSELYITPGSERIRATLERDGHLAILEKLGAKVFANACGPCIGQWNRSGSTAGKPNSIVTSFNRNFTARNDGNPQTCAFVASPETVMAFALTGDLAVNYVRDGFPAPSGNKLRMAVPVGEEFPKNGYAGGTAGYVAPVADAKSQGIRVEISPQSKRLQKFEPFSVPKSAEEFANLPLLLKVKGKCTTDHISPAGKWLQYRGHLDNISNNLFLTAVNAFTGKPNDVKNVFTQERTTLVETARDYKARQQGWVVIAEDNYGEGSSREHAAMEPRYLGCKMVIAKSFARIHETNLKKQGMLAFTFANPADYERIGEDDALSVNPYHIEEGKDVPLQLRRPNGETEVIELKHTFSAAQLAWFKAGSALNMIAL
jgi:aconitate hydratase